MSFYFTKIASAIRRSKNKIISLKEDYELYKKSLETQQPHIYKKQREKIFGLTRDDINKSPQENMNKNPFYWYHQLKQKAFDYLFQKEKFKLIENMNTKIEKTSPQQSKIPSIIKKPFLLVIDSVNYLIKKISFGYIDLKSNMNSLVEKTNLKYFLIIFQNKTFYLISVTKDSIVKFMKKYQDKDINDEFLRKQCLIDQNIDDKSRKAHALFKKFNFFSMFSLTMSNKFKLMNTYVNSSYFRRKYMDLKYISDDEIKDFKKKPFAYIAHKVLNFFSIKRILRLNSTKTKLKTLFIKLIIIYIIYKALKIGYYRLKSNRIDNQYKETLRLFKELKEQNEEILKNNQMIMEENIRLRRSAK